MNYKIIYSKSEEIHIVETSGSFNGASFVQMAKDLLKDQNWKANKNVIFDHRGLSFEEATAEDLDLIRQFHRENETKIGNGKSAIVLQLGFSLKWEMLWSQGEKIKSNNKVQTFEKIEKARNWVKE